MLSACFRNGPIGKYNAKYCRNMDRVGKYSDIIKHGIISNYQRMYRPFPKKLENHRKVV